MKVYQNKSVIVRTIEEKDLGNYLKLFDEEDFGCVGMNWDLKPSIYTEEKVIKRVIDKEVIDEEVLIIEDEGKFIGYVNVYRPNKDQYHIGSIAVKKEKRNQGYGTTLLDTVKSLANRDNCNIRLECIGVAFRYFENHGFKSENGTNYIFKDGTSSLKKEVINPVFVDYTLIEKSREKVKNQNKKDRVVFSKKV